MRGDWKRSSFSCLAYTNVVGYLLKGAEPDAAQVLGLSKIEAGGRVIGKRCGWSENIGDAARARA